jgi:hypothetical protein
MKTRGLFMSALMMGAVMAGCSNEDVLQDIDSKEIQKRDSYIAINIVAPGVDSRAEDDFVAGTAKENAVNNALFVFYNNSGDFVQAVDVAGADLEEWTDGTGSVDKISNAVIVLSNPTSDPTQVVALLNTGMNAENIGTPSLATLKEKAEDYSSTESFVMSNSVYQDAGGNEVVTTQITDKNLQKTATLAKQNPLTITVERVLAKVTAVADEHEVVGKTVELDGEKGITLVPEITGFKVVATHPKSYLLKNIDNLDLSWTWNDAPNFRSYWANSATLGEDDSYGYYTYEQILPVADYAEYCQENTTDTNTQLLVSATIKQENAEEAETILKYKGLYYTEEGFLTKVNSMLSAYKYTTTNDAGETVESNNWAPYLQIVDAGSTEADKPWEVKVALADNVPAGTDVTGVENVLKDLDKAAQWTDGKAYFYVDINHLENVPAVIRNHYYQLAITKIEGLGTPVYEPEETIIPEKMEDEEYFVAAQVQILKWKMVNQSVSLK